MYRKTTNSPYLSTLSSVLLPSSILIRYLTLHPKTHTPPHPAVPRTSCACLIGAPLIDPEQSTTNQISFASTTFLGGCCPVSGDGCVDEGGGGGGRGGTKVARAMVRTAPAPPAPSPPPLPRAGIPGPAAGVRCTRRLVRLSSLSELSVLSNEGGWGGAGWA